MVGEGPQLKQLYVPSGQRLKVKMSVNVCLCDLLHGVTLTAASWPQNLKADCAK